MFSKSEIIEILKDKSANSEIFELADNVRKKYTGNAVHFRALVEFSNICRCFCKYCGLRCENKHIQRYRMLPEEIILAAKRAVEANYKTIVLQSGEDAFFSRDIVCKIITNIKKLGAAVTLSIGERPTDDYKAFKDAGADRYLLRIETTDKNLYKNMHPHMDFENRRRCLYDLKKLGYETGTGCLVGLPDQSVESLADDIMFFKEINADMVGIGPFIPHPDTPLGNFSHGDFELALKVMALTRIILKNANIPATTAMETLKPDGRIIALNCGANVIMPNVTTALYKGKYEIYPGKTPAAEDIFQHRARTEERIRAIGRTIASGYGFRGEN